MKPSVPRDYTRLLQIIDMLGLEYTPKKITTDNKRWYGPRTKMIPATFKLGNKVSKDLTAKQAFDLWIEFVGVVDPQQLRDIADLRNDTRIRDTEDALFFETWHRLQS